MTNRPLRDVQMQLNRFIDSRKSFWTTNAELVGTMEYLQNGGSSEDSAGQTREPETQVSIHRSPTTTSLANQSRNCFLLSVASSIEDTSRRGMTTQSSCRALIQRAVPASISRSSRSKTSS